MSRKRVANLPKFGQTHSDSDLQKMDETEEKSDAKTVKNTFPENRPLEQETAASGVNSAEDKTDISSISTSLYSNSSKNTASTSTVQTPNPPSSSVPISKKLSRITLRKLKIW